MSHNFEHFQEDVFHRSPEIEKPWPRGQGSTQCRTIASLLPADFGSENSDNGIVRPSSEEFPLIGCDLLAESVDLFQVGLGGAAQV